MKNLPWRTCAFRCKFELLPGEVHALIGENGAGKSTLMKILSGVYSKDSGRILIRGKEVEIHNPRAAQNLGICMIHQELNLMPPPHHRAEHLHRARAAPGPALYARPKSGSMSKRAIY